MKKENYKEKMQKFIEKCDNILNNEILIDSIANLNEYITNKRIIEVVEFYVKSNEKNRLIDLVKTCNYQFILKKEYKDLKKQIKNDILNYAEFKYYDELVDNSNNNNADDDDDYDYDYDYDTSSKYYYTIFFSEELLKNSSEAKRILINYIANRIYDFEEYLNFEYNNNLRKNKIEKIAKKFVKDKSLLELLEIVNSNNSGGCEVCL